MPTSKTDAIRIVLVEDHELVRAGLRMLLDTTPGMNVVGEAGDRAQAMQVIGQQQPDVIVLDIDLKGESSLDFLPELQACSSKSRILMLTGVRDPEEHRRAVRQGAMGLVLKEQAAETVVQAIEKIHGGQVWFDANLMASVIAEMSRARDGVKSDPEAAKIATLTEREREVIKLICLGLQNKQIGDKLSITETTVRHHLTSIFNKLGVTNRLELLIYAFRQGLAKQTR